MRASELRPKVAVCDCGRPINPQTSPDTLMTRDSLKPSWSDVRLYINAEPWKRNKKGRK